VDMYKTNRVLMVRDLQLVIYKHPHGYHAQYILHSQGSQSWQLAGHLHHLPFFGELGPGGILGMDNTKSFLTFLSSLHQYSFTYEIELSSYVLCLAYRTLCLIIHISYMSKVRAKLRWWFVVPSGLSVSYACRSIGSES
jgi:hypothetical protein